MAVSLAASGGAECSAHSSVFVRNQCYTASSQSNHQGYLYALMTQQLPSRNSGSIIQMASPINIHLLKGGNDRVLDSGTKIFHVRDILTVGDILLFESLHLKICTFTLKSEAKKVVCHCGSKNKDIHSNRSFKSFTLNKRPNIYQCQDANNKLTGIVDLLILSRFWMCQSE